MLFILRAQKAEERGGVCGAKDRGKQKIGRSHKKEGHIVVKLLLIAGEQDLRKGGGQDREQKPDDVDHAVHTKKLHPALGAVCLLCGGAVGKRRTAANRRHGRYDGVQNRTDPR